MADRHVALGHRAVGSDAHSDRRWPALDAAGLVVLGVEDGQVDGPYRVRANVQETNILPEAGPDADIGAMMQAFARTENVYRLFGFDVYLTQARIFFVHDKDPEPGKKIVGHIRFPWITTVGFRPKQSFLNTATLSLQFQEDLPRGGGTAFHTVELEFDNAFHPGPLALAVVQRVAAHQLRHGAPDPVRADFEALLAPAPLPDPPKGELSEYYLPAFLPFPLGAAYLGDGGEGDPSAWLGPKLNH